VTRRPIVCAARRRANRYQCQKNIGHAGQCSYHYKGSQGGTVLQWWGANPRPADWIDDLSYAQLRKEIYRLRELCEANGIDPIPAQIDSSGEES
jgi:hypothetical protein